MKKKKKRKSRKSKTQKKVLDTKALARISMSLLIFEVKEGNGNSGTKRNGTNMEQWPSG